MSPHERAAVSLRQPFANLAELRQRALRLFRQGQLDEARACLEQALAQQPDNAELCNNLGVILAEQGYPEQAIGRFDCALQQLPSYVHAHHNRGNTLRRMGRLEEAVASYEEALRLNPEAADARNNLGVALLALGRAADAVEVFRRVLRSRPEHIGARSNLGMALAEQGQLAEAAAIYREVLSCQPRSAELHNNLGVALAGQGQLGEAVALYRRALEFKPSYHEAYNNLGNALRQQGELAAAAEALQQALRLKPDYAEAHNNLAIARVRQGDVPSALSSFAEALRLKPDYAEAHYNRAMAWLAQGDFEQGWPEYEWRWRTKEFQSRKFSQPCWDGSPLEGRTILLHAEQGLGDTLQFIRYASLVRQRGGTVLAEVQPPLVLLLCSCSGIDQLIPDGASLPDFDVQVPLLSLPNLLRTRLDSIPADVPYLSADPQRVERWGRKLRRLNGFKIGIAWQGVSTRDDRHRSVFLKYFTALARLPNIQLVSLHKNFDRRRSAAAVDWKVLGLDDHLYELSRAFLDQAALMRHLDLVITSDTVVGHLAGALGVPVWVILPRAADWRWLLEREDSPWYPTMRLFRQKHWDDWDEVFDRVTEALRKQRREGTLELVRSSPEHSAPSQPSFDEGEALTKHGRLDEAEAIYEQILRRQPNLAEAYNNLGIVRLKQGKIEAAIAAYNEALRLRPNLTAARANLAWARLLQGDFARGWPEHERYCRSKNAKPREFKQPLWQGEPLEGRTILLYAEHGLGDTLHLIRYASLVRQRGGGVLAEVQPALASLLCSCPSIDYVVPAGTALPDFDVQAPLLSLPGIFRTTLETIPADMPYLYPDANRVERWGKELQSLKGFKVGIAWQGNPNYPEDQHRSIPLKHYAPLAALSGVRMVSLQKGHGREQLSAVEKDWGVLDLTDRMDEEGGSFLDTAALMHHLDLVITSDTSIAHLAGALAMPVWVALPAACDWRWFLEREDSPWYPTMRLFRQRHLGEWDEVFDRITQALKQQAAASISEPLTDSNGLRIRGGELCAQGRYGEAILCLRRALRLGPKSASTFNNLGMALAQEGQLAEAVHAYRQAIRLRPDYAEAHHNLGEAMQQQGKLAEARAGYEEAVRLKPDLAAAQNSLGVVRADQGEFQEACLHYQEAIRLQPGLATAHHNLAVALERLGDITGASRHYQQALQGRHDSPAACLRLGDERTQQSQLEEKSYGGSAAVEGGVAADNAPWAVQSTAMPMNLTFREDIRLVIWDLDQTFWHGTLTEGEIALVDEHENIVKALAARGIVSSICSKNDFEQVMAILRSKSLDSYFVFPSIDWSSKGKRIKAIIDNAQLRPETVLFLDDNHLDRAEVLTTNPGINVASELFIQHLLNHPQLTGKEDRDLTRLAQYQALERRKLAATSADENGDDYLRNSGIKVFIDYDLEWNLDRCIELINRTNQLNFTKQRLPTDAEQARQDFLKLIHEPRIQGGLIHCHDKYGDHGYVGLYVIAEGKVLKHFLFSCRVLGMGIEQWLYRRLGNPYLKIVGHVLSDPRKDERNVDWIELVAEKRAASQPEPAWSGAKKIDRFYVLGGCVMENISHYLQVFSGKVVHEGNSRRDGIDVPRTHTSFFTYGEWLAKEEFLAAIRQLGCIKEDFENRIFQADEKSAVVLSFWHDQISVLYQHKNLPIELPFRIDGVAWDADMTQLDFDDLPAEFKAAKNAQNIFQYFKDSFTYKGYIEPGPYKKRVALILDKINSHTPIFLLDVPSQLEIKWRERQIQPDMLEPIQHVHRELAAERKNLHVLDPLEFVLEPSERLDWWHFDRKVYFRIFKRIMALLSEQAF